ncbi:hypothetical protein GPECTOR_33g558 [Gonium pectorale]|uniref:phytol kinase n=1 Tax=Gonium pectorale TaxID=33097 RepID=A0A150GCV8_GONPE|nr:hypothetical protein GPECTOR_33g558 [Gonium pectorale]|eukprot:KXZ47676.1 hypothetical protein GPECTOR_33g558 [Gonium pectorale]
MVVDALTKTVPVAKFVQCRDGMGMREALTLVRFIGSVICAAKAVLTGRMTPVDRPGAKHAVVSARQRQLADLAAALRKGVLELAARAVLLLAPLPLVPLERAMLFCGAQMLDDAVNAIERIAVAPGILADPEAARLAEGLMESATGPCVRHAILALGMRQLCAADGGSACGLPAELLEALPLWVKEDSDDDDVDNDSDGDGDGARDRHDQHEPAAGADGSGMYAAEQSVGPRIRWSCVGTMARVLAREGGPVRSRRGRMAVVLRAGWLAVASMPVQGGDGGSAGGDQGRPLRRLLQEQEACDVAMSVLEAGKVLLLPDPPRCWEPWPAEASAELWRLAAAMLRHAGTIGSHGQVSLLYMGKWLASLLEPVGLQEEGGVRLLPAPSAPPPWAAAALRGGVMPILERLAAGAADAAASPPEACGTAVPQPGLGREEVADGSWRLRLLQGLSPAQLVEGALELEPHLAAAGSPSMHQAPDLLLRTLAACRALAGAAHTRPHTAAAATAAAAAAATAGEECGGVGASGPAGAPGWGPGLDAKTLRSLARALRKHHLPEHAAEAEALLEAAVPGGRSRAGGRAGSRGGARGVALTDEAEALVAAMDAAGEGALLRTCANPECVNLEGDSEADLKLLACGRCGAVGYCCRGCQTAHWKSGHKEACRSGV